jgi:ADP-heptose:LPS heptosyltransferase
MEEQKILHLNRPGAIGDIIMTLQVIDKYKKLNHNTKIIYYCDPLWVDIPKICPAIDEVRNSSDFDIKTPGAQNLYGYTSLPLIKHLTWYFGKELGLEDTFYNYGFKPTFKPSQNSEFNSIITSKKHNIITIHCIAGWSPYKNWNINKWQEVVDRLKNYTIIQIGNKEDTSLKNVVDMKGKLSIVESIQLIKIARLHLGIDSFSNHVTALLPHTPSVILWGSTHPMIFGYGHNINIWKPLKCSPCYKIYDWITKNPTGKCPLDKLQSWGNPQHPCMLNITVDEVFNAILKQLNLQKD